MSAAALSSGCKKNTSAATAAAFAAAFGYLFVETTACGFTLGAYFTPVDCLILTLFGILVFIICVFAGFCWTIASVPWSRLANGLVLGLRVLCARTAAMVVYARDMLGFRGFEFALGGLIALESDGMDILGYWGTGVRTGGRPPARTISSKPQLQAWFLDCVSRPRKGSNLPVPPGICFPSHTLFSAGSRLVCWIYCG